MTKEKEPIVFSDEEIVQFLTNYVNEFRRLAESEPDFVKKDLLFSAYPYKITVLVDEKGVTVEYDSNAKNFEIEIKHVKERPVYEKKAGIFHESFANIYLRRIINQPELQAERDIAYLHSLETFQEEEMERAEAEWERYELEKLDEVVNGYNNYTKKAYTVHEKTFSDKKSELYHIIQYMQNEFIIMETYLNLGCLTLFDTLEETMSDLESSMFLAVHGKYEPAMGLLRRYLETTLCSLYYDAELSRVKPTSKSYAALNSKKEKWLEKSFHMKFTGQDSVLDKLLDPDTDYIAKEVIKRTTLPTLNSSFQAYVESKYHFLSKFIHYGGRRELKIDFAEFDEERFKEWNSSFNQLIEICNLLILLKFTKAAETYSQVQQKESGEPVPFLSDSQIETAQTLFRDLTG